MKNNVDCESQMAKGLAHFAEVASTADVSCAIFKDNKRKNANFLQAESIALDIDEGITLKEAKIIFSNYSHAILTTRSHRKEKNGVVADRFRIILELARPITDVKSYYATWNSLYDMFPFIDDQCKDPARFFYKSPELVQLNTNGVKIEPVEHIPIIDDEPKTVTKSEGIVGQLSRSTLDFLLRGAPAGQRHGALYKASRDYNEQGGTKDEFVTLLEKMIKTTGNWGTDYVNSSDMQTIDSAFSEEPRHEPRNAELVKETQTPFNFKRIGDLLKDDLKMDWLVDGLLTSGGLSILVGPPKAGKSTITRQLAKSICRGTPFLGRDVKQGNVLYLALEEQPEMLKVQFENIGLNDQDNLYIHVGSVFGDNKISHLDAAVNELDIDLVIIDTMYLFAQFESGNNYDEVNQTLQMYRDIARKNGTHIIMIHHQNKGDDKGTNSIMGSSAIHGAVDCAIIFNKFGTRRTISTSQRGGKPFDKVDLVYDNDSDIYAIGVNKNDEF